LAGQVNRTAIGRNHGMLHNIHDQLEIVRPVTKWRERVVDADRVAGAVREAFAQMATGRPRPTHVEIPPEAFADAASAATIDPVVAPPAGADPDEVGRAAVLL